MTKLRGYRLDAFEAKPVAVPDLASYLPQVRIRSALRGHLKEPAYGLRARPLIGARKHVRTAEEVREELDLSSSQKLVAILFDQDEILERLFEEPYLVKELGEAGFNLITAASYSVWEPRPRLHQLHNLTRSLMLCVALQKTGGAAIPRLDWLIEHDVKRWIGWLDRNPSVEMVSVDAMTYRSARGWEKLVTGLEQLDRGTGSRLRYLINGPTVEWRWEQLFMILGPDRLTLTDGTLIADTPSPEEQRLFPGPYSTVFGPRFTRRVEERRTEISELVRRAA